MRVFLFLGGAVVVALVILAWPSPSGSRVTFFTAAGPVTVQVEVADQPEEQTRGLMGRSSLEGGMLFIFPREDYHPFWMKDTLIPLDLVYVNKEGEIVDVLTLQPCRADPCPVSGPAAPAMYVVEVNAGFAQERGIIPGVRMAISGS